MKRLIKIVATTLCAGMVLSSGLFARSPVVMAAGEVTINSTNFPDENFRAYVKEKCDTNSDGVLSQAEIYATDVLYVDEQDIKSLKGIEHFTALLHLYCSRNPISSLDISKNTNLIYLWCFESQLTSLDVSKNTELRYLSCYDNQLTSLDISKNTKLEELHCYYNQLTSLDISKNTDLMYLYCSANQLTSLDVSKNTELRLLSCYNNQLTSIDVSKNPKLECLSCDGNQLTSIDVSKNTELVDLGCYSNQLTSLDVSKNPKLEYLYCYDNQLTSLDVSKNPKLYYLFCSDNQLTSLDVSKNVNLWWLFCSSNQLTSLDVSKNPKLHNLYCDDNQLTSLDVSKNVNLWWLHCYSNQLTSLDISNNVVLYNLCKNNDCFTGDHVVWIDEVCFGEVIDDSMLDIDPQTTLTAKGQILYAPTSQPAVSTTPVPTVGPIPTAAPTPQASKSVGSFVDRCYSVALGRDADEGGYNYWLDALNNGEICGAQAGYGFIFSGEYTNKETTNDEFVNDLYSMYFGRTPDEGGFNYWVGLLNNGASREEVFAGFANSTEFDNLCSDYGVVTGAYIVGVPNDQQGGVNAFVARLYNICLTRRPDQAGQAGWSQKLIAGDVTGTTCAYGFVFSPEFIGKEPSNEEFVAYMYRAFFGREADEAGFAAWVSTLNGGGTYEDVFNGFTGSAEFANLCASYGIQT